VARIEANDTGLTLDQARRAAKKVAGDVERGIDPVETAREQRRVAEEERRKEDAAVTTTLKAICEEYLTREGGMTRDAKGNGTFAENRKLRSAPERLAVFERPLYPDDIAGRQIEDIKRSEINKLLDCVKDERGPQSAHQLLAFLSKLFTWYAARNDDFRSPIVRGMGRVKPRERAGKRTLTDEEVQDLWSALDSGSENLPSCYPVPVLDHGRHEAIQRLQQGQSGARQGDRGHAQEGRPGPRAAVEIARLAQDGEDPDAACRRAAGHLGTRPVPRHRWR
jgi:hypothetical protein